MMGVICLLCSFAAGWSIGNFCKKNAIPWYVNFPICAIQGYLWGILWVNLEKM